MGGFLLTAFAMISLSSPFIQFVNHLLASEKWASEKLQAHANKIACFDLQAFALRVKVGADGMLESVAEDAQADVTIRIKLSDLSQILQQRDKAFSYVKIDGDADLANTISFLSDNLRWEVEEDLSRLVGDLAAVKLVSGAKALAENLKRTQQSVQETLAEYFLEENPMLVRPAAIKGFGEQVTQLRDDVERFMKRLEKIERSRK
jgi:ubiquinone biosynthesis accessory factor UbiJ